MNIRAMQAQLDRCCGPVAKPLAKPMPLTGIQKERLAELEAIQVEYSETFKEAADV